MAGFKKTCKVCNKSKPAPGFCRNPNNPDGLRDTCKRCNSKIAGLKHTRSKDPISKRTRQDVKARANGRCEKCGKHSNLELHHMKPVCLNPELGNDMGNIKALCPACHKAEHQKPGMTHSDLAKMKEAMRPRKVKEMHV